MIVTDTTTCHLALMDIPTFPMGAVPDLVEGRSHLRPSRIPSAFSDRPRYAGGGRDVKTQRMIGCGDCTRQLLARRVNVRW